MISEEFKKEAEEDALREFLISKNLEESTISKYVFVVKRFLKTSPNIYESKSYINFIGNNYREQHKKTDLPFWALVAYIRFKFKDKDVIKEKLLKDFFIIANTKKKYDDSIAERKNLTFEEFQKIIINMEELKHQIMGLILSRSGLRSNDLFKLRFYNIQFDSEDGKEILELTTTGKGSKKIKIYICELDIINILLDYIFKKYSFIADKSLTLHENLEDFKKLTNERIDSDSFKDRDVFYKNMYSYVFLDLPVWKKAKKSLYSRIEFEYNKLLIDFKQACKKAGFAPERLALHDMKRLRARMIFSKYNSLPILKSELNHNSVDTSLLYIKNLGLEKRNVALEMANPI